MTSFRIREHDVIAGRAAVDIFNGGKLIGCVYVDEMLGAIRFVSKYIVAVDHDKEEPPVVTVTLKREAYAT